MTPFASRRAGSGLLAFAFAGFSGCYTDRAARLPVPTLAVEGYEYQVRRFVGQTIRVCGRVVLYEGDWSVERIPTPGEFYFHGRPRVLIATCGAAAPGLDPQGCITGRIAARDGALVLPLPRAVVQDDSPVDREWLLHPNCPRRR